MTVNTIEDILKEVNKIKDKADASMAIIESGSNSDGSYIKYGDGTMICYSNKTYTDVPMSTGTGALFSTSTLHWAYPAAFVSDLPATFITPRTSTFGIFAQQDSISFSNINFKLTGTINTTINSIMVSLAAIGRWK